MTVGRILENLDQFGIMNQEMEKFQRFFQEWKKVQKAMKKMSFFFSKSIISLLWHKKWQSDMLVIWKYSFVLQWRHTGGARGL